MLAERLQRGPLLLPMNSDLSRRRSRVRVPSLPSLSKLLQLPFSRPRGSFGLQQSRLERSVERRVGHPLVLLALYPVRRVCQALSTAHKQSDRFAYVSVSNGDNMVGYVRRPRRSVP